MKTSSFTQSITGLGLGLALAATAANAGDTGILYTTDNASAGNHVLVITRTGHAMSVTATYATGGLGLMGDRVIFGDWVPQKQYPGYLARADSGSAQLMAWEARAHSS